MKYLSVVVAATGLMASSTMALAAGDVAAGETVFKKCVACHNIEKDQPNKVGPNLNGVIGRARKEDYKYSKVLDEWHAAGNAFDETTIDEWLAKPTGFLKGNKMAFPGLPKAEDRANVIAYIEAKSAE